MWIITMFDLPTVTERERRDYARFRKKLINDGFTMLQYSVYARHCASAENIVVHSRRITSAIPDAGEVRLLKLTDKQFGRMEVYYGKKRKPTESPPLQYELF